METQAPLDLVYHRLFRQPLGFSLDLADHASLSTLTLAPATALFAICPLFYFRHQSELEVISSGYLLWAKMVFAATLLTIELLNLTASVSPSLTSAHFSFQISSTNCLAAICLLAILYSTHKRTFRSSALLSTWLVAAIACDLTRAQLFSAFTQGENITNLARSSAAVKGFLLVLEELPKLRYIADLRIRQASRWQSTCGLLTRSLIFCPYEELTFGFRNVDSLRQLYPLDPGFSAEKLSERFLAYWTSVDKAKPHCLMKTCILTLFPSIINTAFCHIVFVIFHSSQPLYIYCVVCFLESEEKAPNEGLRIFIATFIVFLGKYVARAAQSYSEGHLTTLFQAVLISAIHDKSLRQSKLEHEDFSPLTLIEENLEGVVDNLRRLYMSFAAVVEISAWIYTLTLIHGRISIFMLLPSLLSQLAGWRIGKWVPTTTETLAESTEQRTSKISKLLTEIKAVRVMGLGKATFTVIDQLHHTETISSIAAQLCRVSLMATSSATDTFLYPVLITTKLFWPSQPGGLHLRNIFTTAATFYENAGSLHEVLSFSTYFSVFSCNLSRIRDYLLLDEWINETEITPSVNNISLFHNGHQQPETRVIEFTNVSLAPQGSDKAVLLRMDVTLNRGEVMIVTGPKRCGKTTFLLSLLYESRVLQGSAYIKPGRVAYCGKVTWICNLSIRYNIIRDAAFNVSWYNQVLEACCLKEDLQTFPDYDTTAAGVNGSNLTEEQKQKVALARAVYSEPDLVVIDDIFGFWDLITANEVFSRICGPNGLLRSSATTVVLTALSIPYLQSADRVLVIEANGTSVQEVYSSKPAFHRKLARLVNDIEAASQTMKGNTTEDAIDKKEEQDENLQTVQQRDRLSWWEIFLLYLHSFPPEILLACTFLAAIAGVTEIGGAAYFYIWVGIDIRSRWLYVGFCAFSSLNALTTATCFWLLFSKAVPSSVRAIHRQTLDVVLRCTFGHLTAANQERARQLFDKDIAPLSSSVPDKLIRMCYGTSVIVFHLVMATVSTTSPFVVATLGAVALFTILQNYLRVSANAERLRHESTTPLYSYLNETAAGLHYIRSFGWQGQRRQQLYQLVDKYQKSDCHIDSLGRWLNLSSDIVSLILAMVVIFTAVYIESSASAVAVALLSLFQLGWINARLTLTYFAFNTQFKSLVRIRNFVKSIPLEADVKDNFELHEEWPRNGKVLFEKVSIWRNKRDDGTPPVLSNVTAYIPGGWKVGIVGRPGSGKTSLILALLNFLEYTGRIVIDGVDISKVPRQVLRERIVTISQDSIDLDGTVRSCLDPWGLHNGPRAGQAPTDDQMEKVLRRLKLWVKISENGGLDGKVSGMKFTSDQRKMMCIARACIHKLSLGTRLVVVDDAMADFHPDQDKIARRAMKEFMSDCTILMVAHRMESLRNVRMTIQMIFESAKVRIHQPQEEDEVSRDRERDRELPPAMKDYGPVEEIPAELEEIVRLSEQGEERPREEEDAGLGASSRQQRQ